jgi:hypothetical protein
MTTNYNVKTEGVTKDLVELFYPIQNYVEGTYTGDSYDFLGYGGDASSNSFVTITDYLNGDVETGIHVNVPLNRGTSQPEGGYTNLSYLQFNEPGMYKLDLSMKYTSGGYSTANVATLTNVIRLFQSNTDGSNNSIQVVGVPDFGAKMIYNMSFSGNGSNTTTNNATSSANDNLIYMFGLNVNNNMTGVNEGYPVFRPVTTFYGSSSGPSGPYKNMYNLSVTFNLTQQDIDAAIDGVEGAYRIIPQIQGLLNLSDQQIAFRFEGNWRVTKLFELSPTRQVGSLLSSDASNNLTNTAYASGFASKSLATSGQPFTIELYFRVKQVTANNQVLFMLGGATNCPYISYVGTDDLDYPHRIRLYVYNSSYGTPPLVSNSTTEIMTNRWHHLAITCSPSTIYPGESDWTMYLDGKNQNTRRIEDSFFNTNTSNITLNNLFYPGDSGLMGNTTNLRLTQKVVYTGDEFKVPHVPLQATQTASTNISAINSGECICLTQCYDDSYLLESITNIDLIPVSEIKFSSSKPSF